MNVSTSSTIENKYYSTINNHQNGYVKNSKKLTEFNDVELKNAVYNHYIPNHYNQDQNTFIQNFSLKKNLNKFQTDSLMQPNNDNINNNENDILLTLSTPTKENEEYYTALIKPSPILAIVNNNKDSCCIPTTINNNHILTDNKTMPFCIQKLQKSIIDQHEASFFNQNNQNYISER